MKVHVLSAYPTAPANPNNFQAQWVRESAALDPQRIHELTDDPAKADIVLFVENHPGQDPLFFQVSRHPVWRRHRRRAFLYQDNDYAYPFLPGLYPSLFREHQRDSRCAGATYVGRIEQNESVRYEPLAENPPLLFSFMGSVNCKVRERICALKGDHALIRDTTGRNLWSQSTAERKRYTDEYAEVINDSAFVLCPRGLGPSSYRLYETMEAGRVPVVLADQWVAPPGPDWSACSLQISEAEVERLPEILSARKGAARAMSLNARATWERYFSKPMIFHQLTESCRAILEARKKTNAISELFFSAKLLRTNPRQLLRLFKQSMKNGG